MSDQFNPETVLETARQIKAEEDALRKRKNANRKVVLVFKGAGAYSEEQEAEILKLYPPHEKKKKDPEPTPDAPPEEKAPEDPAPEDPAPKAKPKAPAKS